MDFFYLAGSLISSVPLKFGCYPFPGAGWLKCALGSGCKRGRMYGTSSACCWSWQLVLLWLGTVLSPAWTLLALCVAGSQGYDELEKKKKKQLTYIRQGKRCFCSSTARGKTRDSYLRRSKGEMGRSVFPSPWVIAKHWGSTELAKASAASQHGEFQMKISLCSLAPAASAEV